MSHGKQFTLFSHIGGPNGWNVAMVLDELNLTYETKFLDFAKNEQKAESHAKYNPNGRIPTLIDHHNNDFAIWESDAIIVYLVDKYDTEHKISASDANEKYTQLQWLFFQASGQGPYFGQLAWFVLYHHEKIPSAIERYQNEIRRVFGVLNDVLSEQDWLVGGRFSVTDLSFIPWTDNALKVTMKEDLNIEDYPAVAAWYARLNERASVQKFREDKRKPETQSSS